MRTSKTVLGVMLLACSCSALGGGDKPLVPCDRHDAKAREDLALNAARSKLEREACKGDATCIERVLAERDAYVFERCKLPEVK